MRLRSTAAFFALLTVALTPRVALAQSPGPPDSKVAIQAAAEPVMRQLEAFRRHDFDTAYGFASLEIQQRFDRVHFEEMVRGGYPEIARSVFAVVAEGERAANGNVYLVLKIRGANGLSIEAVYEMVSEPSGWRINGVVTKPDPGVV
ncbi:MAG TPA: DUF4864 domain-containing protein [Verrucomicrobiae bacterium]|jgi:hypothetical protein|nr:DUF4864 domain-containing protein [Verrucomicrobiae bacterium]